MTAARTGTVVTDTAGEPHVYIIGSKGIPAQYGGFETFVEELTAHQVDRRIRYHVACLAERPRKVFFHNGAECFTIVKKPIGPANAIVYDIAALCYSLRDIRVHHYQKAIIYVLACRIGPFIGCFKKELRRLGVTLCVNPDGHEWLRAKWRTPVKKYWKYSERLMVKQADLLICDSKTIEEYIHEEYGQYQPRTTYIAYGADLVPSDLADDNSRLQAWYAAKRVKPHDYYLVVGRFVPENNYETMIREFMATGSTRDFVLITNVEGNKFYERLRAATHFDQDRRIKFVGTVYDQQLLKKIRENAFAYFHGHEVGGTNPSLIEALGATGLNLLLGVGFNREVAQDGALYWTKEPGSLAGLIAQVESPGFSDSSVLRERASRRVHEAFTWESIVASYESLFMAVTDDVEGLFPG